MFRDALLVAGKDLRLEHRSRVGLIQVVPFGLVVLFLFAFALDVERGVLQRATPGLYWVTVLFATVLGISRAFSVEGEDGVLDALRLAGMDPAGVFLGKVLALVVWLLAVELVLGAGVLFLYSPDLGDGLLTAVTVFVTTFALAGAGATYGAISVRLRERETVLPLLLLPVLAPVLLAATRSGEVAMGFAVGSGWPWVGLLGIFAVVSLGVGAILFRPLLEDA